MSSVYYYKFDYEWYNNWSIEWDVQTLFTTVLVKY